MTLNVLRSFDLSATETSLFSLEFDGRRFISSSYGQKKLNYYDRDFNLVRQVSYTSASANNAGLSYDRHRLHHLIFSNLRYTLRDIDAVIIRTITAATYTPHLRSVCSWGIRLICGAQSASTLEFRDRDMTLIKTIPVTAINSTVVDLCVVGQRIYLTSSGFNRLYVLDMAGNVLGYHDTTGKIANCAGVCFDGKYFYLSDSSLQIAYQCSIN